MQNSATELEPIATLLSKIGLAEVEAVLECLIERRHLCRLLSVQKRSKPHKVRYGDLQNAFWFFYSETSEVKTKDGTVKISASQFALIREHSDALLEYTP